MTLFPSKLGTVRLRKIPVVADELGRVSRNTFDYLGRLPFKFRHEYGFAFERPPKLLDVVGIHPREEVEVLGVIGDDPDDAGYSRHPVRQARRDGKRVWTAARAADDGEALDPEVIGKRADILDAVDDASARMPVGSSVAGAVVGDDSRSGIRVDALVVVPAQARPRRSVQREDGEAVRVAPFGIRQCAPIASRRALGL